MGEEGYGGYCHNYMGYIGMYCCEGYGFQAVYCEIGYMNQRVGSTCRYHFSFKLINWLKILVYIRETGNCHSRIQKNQIGFVLPGLC